jgi:hypothetical protein
MKIEITGDINKLLNLDKQIAFAAASTLTKVAKLAQAEVLESLDKEFHLRGSWFKPTNKHGIKVSSGVGSILGFVEQLLLAHFN